MKALKKTKKFGLIFAEPLPETMRLPHLPAPAGELVALKREPGNQLWRMKDIHDGAATCEPAVEGYATPDQRKTFPVSDFVVVRNFGDLIYPTLVPVDRVARRAGQAVAHAQTRPTTPARDWKYNNDYVDKTDTFRHSKWLSMMKKRLLRSDGVMIVAIDENELAHLGTLLEEIFPEYDRFIVCEPFPVW